MPQLIWNLKGTFLMSKYAIPYIAKRGGAIVNNASIFGLNGGGGGRHIVPQKAGSLT
ncbi:MAG: hypothetical protein IPJ47_07175 [Anaerolineales bacterium]|nr:hypothetical protein [Anaerolineales bacterium]